jgi:hypothetical protein
MTRATAGRRLAHVLLASMLAAQLAACGSTGSGDISGDDVVSGLGSALSLATAVAGVANSSGGGGGRNYSTPSHSAPAPAYKAPASAGYSQRGAFEDCANLYNHPGMEQQRRTCQQRANNMGSLH